jgi:hypothetical protein
MVQIFRQLFGMNSTPSSERSSHRSDDSSEDWTRQLLQPVLLLGPREVGKSSLIRMLTDPNQSGLPERTFETRRAAGEMTLTTNYHFRRTEPHPHDRHRTAMVDIVPGLRFIDIPGEIHMQADALSIAAECAEKFRKETSTTKVLGRGIVLVCMFSGDPKDEDEVKRYYAQDTLAGLERHVRERTIRMEEVIFLFNKFDRWRAALRGIEATPSEMRKELAAKHRTEIDWLCRFAGQKFDEANHSVATVLGKAPQRGAGGHSSDVDFHDLNVGRAAALITRRMCEYSKTCRGGTPR